MELLENQNNDIEITIKKVSVLTKENSVLINDVSFQVLPKEMVALMGPSGSGKSTLLNVLSGRTEKDLCTYGEILING
ncbi:PHNC1 [Hepatospora eriocheir]|uniref:PHNC1 n=1 Tax=Hepatospora eriocheir TaxID=1081669 RepID=A0A1X0QFI4_9MICR|nr:PHNC1 [Hepatospora eriocheir]